MIRLELRCLGGIKLPNWRSSTLRFFLHGESPLVYALYELLLNNTCQVQLRPLRRTAGRSNRWSAPSSSLRPVGFGPDEGMLPYTPRSFLGYRLLQEYFAFPEKFLFFDLGELDRAVRAGFRDGRGGAHLSSTGVPGWSSRSVLALFVSGVHPDHQFV